jgi:hypothetical protein
MNHLEVLTAEWLAYKGYFTRSAVRVGRRKKGGWDGELDVVGFNATLDHFVHVECSTDAKTWADREKMFLRKFRLGREHAGELFAGIQLPAKLDKVVVHGYASAPNKHRSIGGGRLVTSQELAAEILNGIPTTMSRSAIPETLPLMRTLQLSLAVGIRPDPPSVRLIPEMIPGS